MASIHLRDIVKRYGSGPAAVQVIHGVSAEVADGEFVVIVGPSGCGKSTLLRMVAGLESVSGGEIAIGDRVVNHVDPSERDIAMVFQNYALYPHMSVFDNMAYGLKIRGLARDEIRRRVEQAARTLQLEGLLERRPRQLSGGQRQRVAMGRAIVRSPRAFLFDEPLSNLDAALRAQTRLEIRRLHQQLGVTSLFVTHDQVEAMTLAQRMLVMNAGRIEQFDTPEAVYERPASVFVAGFIGSPPMNLLRGTAQPGPGLRLDGPPATVLPVPDGVLPANGGPLVLGVRPEHLQPCPTGTPGAWTMTLDGVELLGSERLLHGTIAGQALTVRVEAQGPAPASGAAIGLLARSDRLHAFDAASGLRLPSPGIPR